MQTKFNISDEALLAELHHSYSLQAAQIDFIPLGDSAYSYRVNGADGQWYYLKLFDSSNERQRRGIDRLPAYLPLTWELYHSGLFTRITYPIKNVRGEFATALNGVTMVLFNYLHGETLAEAHPFSDDILVQVGKAAADLHKITRFIDPALAAEETFDISFDSDLSQCISALETVKAEEARNASIIETLRELILPQKENLLSLMELVRELRGQNEIPDANRGRAYVLCHGDLWGGNLIRHAGELYLIDWEAAMLAPPEYNFFSYMGDGFAVFVTAYEKQLQQSFTVNPDLLRFYAYRAHLRNLTNWLMNILYRNTDEAQNINDLEMIRHHCLNRMANVEENVRSAEAFLQSRG
jgi:spectinomycin phosphotransferase